MKTLEIHVADITALAVDAIVNAANLTLLGGGGVDGAIHRAGGPAILQACKEIRQETWPEGLPTGQAVITTGGQLAARYVIHTVGPIYQSDPFPAKNLAACYSNCLQLARDYSIKEIAFPCISTGVYGFPKAEAAAIAVTEIQAFLADNPGSIERVLLVAFSTADATLLKQAFGNRSLPPQGE